MAILKASLQQAAVREQVEVSHGSAQAREKQKDRAPEMMALVEAMAGMMRLTTPCVRLQVTPSMLYCSARVLAVSKSH